MSYFGRRELLMKLQRPGDYEMTVPFALHDLWGRLKTVFKLRSSYGTSIDLMAEYSAARLASVRLVLADMGFKLRDTEEFPGYETWADANGREASISWPAPSSGSGGPYVSAGPGKLTVYANCPD